MAPSLANVPDYYLWVGLGVFTFFAVKQVSYGLQNIGTLTEIHNAPPHAPQPQHLPPNPTHQEDAIKTSSLLTLATSPNIDIRNSATKILCQRFYANDTAKKILVRDLNSKNEDKRHHAQLAFELLATYGALRDIKLPPVAPRDGWRVHEPSAASDGLQGETNAADLRRRRREAVVIHDGEVDRPIGSEDVYMRDQEGRMLTEEAAGLEEGIAQLQEADRLLQAGLYELMAGGVMSRLS